MIFYKSLHANSSLIFSPIWKLYSKFREVNQFTREGIHDFDNSILKMIKVLNTTEFPCFYFYY